MSTSKEETQGNLQGYSLDSSKEQKSDQKTQHEPLQVNGQNKHSPILSPRCDRQRPPALLHLSRNLSNGSLMSLADSNTHQKAYAASSDITHTQVKSKRLVASAT